jgi:Virulence factor
VPEQPDSEPASSRTGRRGRGGEGPQIIVISWRDIPAQVNAQQGRDRHQVILSGRFQRAIDRAKRKAKIYTAHEDISQWSRAARPCGPDLGAEALAEAARIEAAYSREHLGRLGFLGGWEPANKPPDEVLDESVDLDDDDEPDDETLAATGDVSEWGTWSSRPDEQVNPLAAESSEHERPT